MPTQLALQKLKNDLVTMGEMCENSLDTALMALLDRDAELACYVIDYDHEIDEMELKIDQQCVDLMREGLSGECLRFVASTAKINNDLERVGDLALEIAENVLFLVREKSVLPQVVDFLDMANLVAQMMRESIDALIERDPRLAWKLIEERRIVDDEMQLSLLELMEIMHHDSRTIERCVHILFIIKGLMRIADQASNVAEEVIYMVEGVTVRHHLREMHTARQLPLRDEDRSEIDAIESRLLKKRRSRSEIRRIREESRDKSTAISTEQVQAAARSGRTKVKTAREKLLALRAAKKV